MNVSNVFTHYNFVAGVLVTGRFIQCDGKDIIKNISKVHIVYFCNALFKAQLLQRNSELKLLYPKNKQLRRNCQVPMAYVDIYTHRNREKHRHDYIKC